MNSRVSGQCLYTIETGLDCRDIVTEYKPRVHCTHMLHLFCNALVHVIYSGLSGQCSHTIPYIAYTYTMLVQFCMAYNW